MNSSPPSSLLTFVALLVFPCHPFIAAEPGAPAFVKTPFSEVPMMEIAVPEPPTVLHARGLRSLCYEIHITNLSKGPFTLDRVRVFADDGATLLDSSGESLAALIYRAGKRIPSEADASPIKSSERVVYFSWVDLQEGADVPKTIRHELSFKPDRGDARTIRAAEVPVKSSVRIIAPPLRGENWGAFNGPSNTSFHRRAIFAFDGAPFVGQRYAIDWLQLDAKTGEPLHGDANDNASYYGYGKEVYAVADGVVSAVTDGIPENKGANTQREVPITIETVTGNQVILDIGGGCFAFYAHLQPGKIAVKRGDHVKTGDVLGLLGNSGNSSAPHLHFHLCDRNSALASQGLPFAFESFSIVGRIIAKKGGESGPEWLTKPEACRREMPAENEVVSFAPNP